MIKQSDGNLYNSPDTNQEIAFVRAFINPAKQDRYLLLLSNPKYRRRILNDLYHRLPSVLVGATTISSKNHFPETVEKILRQKGAGSTCYVISPEAELDQREMPLRETLEKLIMEDSVGIACCIPGNLAYYKSENAGYTLNKCDI